MTDATDRPREVEGVGCQRYRSAVDHGWETAEVRCHGMVNATACQPDMLACTKVSGASSRLRGGGGMEQ